MRTIGELPGACGPVRWCRVGRRRKEMSTIAMDPWYLYVASLPHHCCLVPPKRGAIRGGWPRLSEITRCCVVSAMAAISCVLDNDLPNP